MNIFIPRPSFSQFFSKIFGPFFRPFFNKFFSQDRKQIFRNAVLCSLLLHLLIGLLFWLGSRWNFAPDSTMEIDLTRSFRLGNPLLKAGGGTTPTAVKKEGAPLKTQPIPQKVVPPKEWILPSDKTKILEKPQVPLPPVQTNPNGTDQGSAEGFQSASKGSGGGEGEGGGVPLSQLPRLLNRSEILTLLRKNYPRSARESGLEGSVIVTLHLAVTGAVLSCEVVRSSNNTFNAVAETVARRMKFSPALMSSGPVPAKIRQTLIFQLEE